MIIRLHAGSFAAPNICLRYFSWLYPASRSSFFPCSFFASFSGSLFVLFLDPFAIKTSRCSMKAKGQPRSALFNNKQDTEKQDAEKQAAKKTVENASTFATHGICESDFSHYSSYLHAHTHVDLKKISTISAE
ncbi:hypothetical protein KUV74_14245 [Halomonas sp. DP1Y21-3]|uniref:hypothetical protein n=1 Tax=Halomonas sp. DP1Y21-3 TaxID=2859080 RepID=UPI001C9704A4|nr:hypothetical protein [Halomonas sp. DP1Y21-3]MBY6111558.1 hypothetical protein [Halomonas sp. DP1Y21-3]